MPLIPLYYRGCVSRAYFDGGQSRTLAFALNILRLCNPLIFHMRVRSTCVTAVIFIFRLRFLCTLARFSPLIALSSYSSFSFFLSLFSLYSLIRYFLVFFFAVSVRFVCVLTHSIVRKQNEIKKKATMR